jgi:hypothetical protein
MDLGMSLDSALASAFGPVVGLWRRSEGSEAMPVPSVGGRDSPSTCLGMANPRYLEE